MINMQNLRSLLAQQAAQSSKPLVEFRAGILTQSGTTVKADARKGKFVLTQGDDGMLHVQWFLRPSNNKEFDLTIVPGGATLERVEECKDGRVYLMKMTQSQARRWFWMQEPKEDKDEETCKQINEYFKNPPPLGGGDGESEHSQLMRMLQGAGGPLSQAAEQQPNASSGPVVTPSSPSSRPVDHQPMGTGSQENQQAAQQAAALAQIAAMAQGMQRSVLPLSEVLDSARVLEALDDDSIQALLPHLPEGQQTPAALREQLRGPQLQQTVGRLSSVLNSAQFGTVMASLGLPLGADMGVPAFLDAVQKEADKEKESEGGN